MMKDLLGPGVAIKRAIFTMTMTAAIATSLSGCLFAYDAAKPTVTFVNDYPEPVIFTIEGGAPETVLHVPSERSGDAYVENCYGTGIRVESESGEALGRVDEQACPDWRLTFNEDGSLTYEEVTQ